MHALEDGKTDIRDMPFPLRTLKGSGDRFYKEALRYHRYSRNKGPLWETLQLLYSDIWKLPPSSPMRKPLFILYADMSADLKVQLEQGILGGIMDVRDFPFELRNSPEYGRILWIYSFRVLRYSPDTSQFREVLELLESDYLSQPEGSPLRNRLEDLCERYAAELERLEKKRNELI